MLCGMSKKAKMVDDFRYSIRSFENHSDIESSMLESIPGEIIAKAAAMLPDADSAPDEPQHVEVRHGGPWIRITFRRFMYTHGKTTLWSWTAQSARVERPPA
jgi:hypothetical protein